MSCGQVVPQSCSDIKHIVVVTCRHALLLTASPKRLYHHQLLFCQKCCRNDTWLASHIIQEVRLRIQCQLYRASTSTLHNTYQLSHNVCCSYHVVIALQGAGVDEDYEREAMFEQARPTPARGPAPAPPRLLNPHPLQLKVVAYFVCTYFKNACSHAVSVYDSRFVPARCVEQSEAALSASLLQHCSSHCCSGLCQVDLMRT